MSFVHSIHRALASLVLLTLLGCKVPIPFVTPPSGPIADPNAGGIFQKMGLSKKYGNPVCPSSLAPNVRGCYFNVLMAQVNPQPGVYDWAMVDQELNSTNYPLQVEIQTGELGVPTTAAVCKGFTTEAGAPTCQPWLGPSFTQGIAVHVEKAIGALSACAQVWSVWPGDRKYQKALSALEIAFYQHYQNLIPSRIALFQLAVVAAQGHNLGLPISAPCGASGAMESYNAAWAKLAAKNGITTEPQWQNFLTTQVSKMMQQWVTNMPAANINVGIAGGGNASFPALAGNGTPDPSAHDLVWKAVVAQKPARGAAYVSYEALQATPNFGRVVGPWVKPSSAWGGGGEDVGKFSSDQEACMSWSVCSQPEAQFLRPWEGNVIAWPGALAKAAQQLNGQPQNCSGQTSC